MKFKEPVEPWILLTYHQVLQMKGRDTGILSAIYGDKKQKHYTLHCILHCCLPMKQRQILPYAPWSVNIIWTKRVDLRAEISICVHPNMQCKCYPLDCGVREKIYCLIQDSRTIWSFTAVQSASNVCMWTMVITSPHSSEFNFHSQNIFDWKGWDKYPMIRIFIYFVSLG